MKYLMLIILSVCLVTTLMHAQQQDPVKQFYKKYRHKQDATHLSVGGLLLDFVTKHNDDEDTKSLLERVHKLRILTVPGADVVAPEDILSLRQGVLGSGFEELITVRDKGNLVHIYLQESADEVIEQLLILVEDPEEVTLVSLLGELRYEDLQHLNLDGPGGEALQKSVVP